MPSILWVSCDAGAIAPPKSTLVNDRFIEMHYKSMLQYSQNLSKISHTMMYDKMDPLTPIKDPIVVNNGLSSIKPACVVIKSFSGVWNLDHTPSATIAHPEYAFSTVITTATPNQNMSIISFVLITVLTHISATNGGSGRVTLDETQNSVCSKETCCDGRCRWSHRQEPSH